MQSITVPAALESLARISDFVTDASTRAGLDDHAAWQVQLAVDEAATNIIQHGYAEGQAGEIELSWRVDGVEFAITLRDRGKQFNPSEVPPPNLTAPLEERQPGGLGIYLMNRLMDTVRFSYDQRSGNTLTMTKRIGPAAAPARIFELRGRLDAVGTNAAIAQVRAAVSAGTKNILLDMAGVVFMSSSGLRALLMVRKDLIANGGELRLCELQPQVYEVFAITGFTQVFAIHRTRDDAIAAFGQHG
ncbi:MAG: anti-sigma factor antagonist [Roseiflexaceae bacterium]